MFSKVSESWAARLLLAAVTFLIIAPAGQAQFVRGRVLVKFRAGVSGAQGQAAIASLGAQSVGTIPGIGVQIVSLPANANETAFARAFGQRGDVEFAELDRIVIPSDVTPNDPWYADWQWHLPRIQAPAAWSITTGVPSVIIAIVDTGVDATHPDLAGKIVPGWNTYNNNSDSSDVYGHGTKVAGTAAAITNNGAGVAGVCWGCYIMPIRASATDGTATYSALANGVIWAADHGARVANISYMVTDSSTVTSAASYMRDHGGVVSISAGNYATFDSTPDNPYVLTVSATDSADLLYSWSNTGNNVDLAAPGCVYTTTRGGGYGSGCGTSFSAPIVAGVAALVISQSPGLSGAQVMSQIQDNADDLGAPGKDPSYGWGRVNAANAVKPGGSPPPDTTTPSVSITSPGAGASVSGTVTIQASASDDVGVSSVSFYVDGAPAGSDTSAPYSVSWNTTAVANGSHTLTATARDAAGNQTSASVAVTVNNTVPDTTKPSVAITSPSSGSTVSGSVTVQASASDNVGVSSVSFYVDGALAGNDGSAPYTYSWNTSGTANGSHTLTATAQDAAGNQASASIAVNVNNVVPDTTAPSVAITSPSSGSTVSGSVTIQASASDNVGVSSVSFYVDGALAGSDASAPYAYAWNTTAVPNGSHTLTATARDAAGNQSSASVIVNVNNVVPDTTAPSVAITSPSSGSTVSGSVTIQASASDNVGVSSVSFYIDGALAGTDTSAPYAYSWNTPATANGSHTLTATARDAAGNQSSASVIVNVNNVVPDTTPPSVAITSPSFGSTVSGSVTVQAAASDNVGVSSVSFYVDGALMGTDTSAPFSLTWNTMSASDSSHTISAMARDAAGNSASASSMVMVNNQPAAPPPAQDTAPPVISITSPAPGVTLDGNTQITVDAYDNVGVVRVELWVDGDLSTSSTSAPFTNSWNTKPKKVADGAHTLQVRAYDAAGNVGLSTPITVYK